MIFSVETYESVVPDIKVLLPLHWTEVGAFDKDAIPLSPNWEVYDALNSMKKLFIVTAREKGNLVGYVVFILQIHPHYSTVAIAENDVLFLSKEYREGLTGYKLIKYAVGKLKQYTFNGIPIRIIGLSMKAEHAFFAIAERLDFKLTDMRYTLEV